MQLCQRKTGDLTCYSIRPCVTCRIVIASLRSQLRSPLALQSQSKAAQLGLLIAAQVVAVPWLFIVQF